MIYINVFDSFLEVLEQMLLDAKHSDQEKKASADIVKLKSQLVYVSKELEESRSKKEETNKECSMFPEWMLPSLGYTILLIYILTYIYFMIQYK